MSDDRANQADAEVEDVVDEEAEPEADESEPEADAGEDDAGEGDEGEDAGDAGEADAEAGGEAEQVGEPTRRETRVQRLANERRREKERADRLERELAEARRSQPQPQQPRETPEQRAERLALMDPDQRTQYLVNEQAHFNNQRFQALERHTLATSDKTSFDRLCDRDPACAAVADMVETEFNNILGQGRFVTREALANYFIGQNVRKRGGRAASQQRRRGAERIASQRTRAPGGRSDVAAERRPRADSKEARERRLKDVEI